MLTNFKYYAGLIDADGHIGFQSYKQADGWFRLSAVLSLSQRADKVFIFKPLEEEYGNLHRLTQKGPCEQGILSLGGQKAVNALNLIGKHLVIKRPLAGWAISQQGRVVSQQELKALKKELSGLRASRQLSGKSYPSRQWCAGYIDGDGCLTSSLHKGRLQFKISVAAHANDPQGIELLGSHFGGNFTIHQGGTRYWNKYLSERGDGERVLGYFLKHLKLKRQQGDLIMSCLQSGKHLSKNGATPESNAILHQELKMLKRPQRLSELTPAGEATVWPTSK